MTSGLKTLLASEVSRARALTVKRRAEYDMLVARALEKDRAAAACAQEMQNLADCVVIMQNFAGQIQTGIVGKFEDLLNRGIREIFKRDYKVQVVFEAKANSFWADIMVTLPNGNRIPISKDGGGLKNMASLLSRILYLILDPTQPAKILFLDESLAGLDVWRSPEAYSFITATARGLGIQIIFITHNAEITSGENPSGFDRIIKFSNENDRTSVSTIYG